MRQRLDQLVIRTPEGYRFSYPLAGPVSRLLAWLVDVVVVIAMILASFLILSWVIALSSLGIWLIIALPFGIWIGYGMAFEWFWGGRTLGKKLLGLRVMDERGLRLTFAQLAVRNLLRAVDMLPLGYLLGGIFVMLTRRCQRLGDLAAGTVVVRPRLVISRSTLQSIDHKYNSFRDFPTLELRLRQQVTPAEARLAMEALSRRDWLEPASRVEVFAELAEHFRELQPFPASATEGLTDEQYVRNVVETVYRPLSRHEASGGGATRGSRVAADSQPGQA